MAALFARLKEEVRAAGPRSGDVTPAQVRLSTRDQAERLWPISAERPLVGKAGPVKLFLRRFMRWYVEPALADQRAFTDAVLKLIDDLDERIARLETKNLLRNEHGPPGRTRHALCVVLSRPNIARILGLPASYQSTHPSRPVSARSFR